MAEGIRIGGGGKKEGAYVWRKCQYTPAVTVENPQFDLSCSNSTTATIKNANFDLSKIENYIDFFDGLTATTTSTGHDYFIKQSDGTLGLMVASMLIIVTSFDSVTGTFTLNNKATVNRTYVYTGTKNLSDEKKTFINFVVSNNPTAYPDRAVHTDGYWYEKVVEMTGGFDCGEITPSASLSQITVEHNLGVVPTFALIQATAAQTGGSAYSENVTINSLYRTLWNGGSNNYITTSGNAYGSVNCDETSITFTGSYNFLKGHKYVWLAIV